MLIGGYHFKEPVLLSRTDFIDRAAIYVILCSSGSGKYNVIYVGETGELGTRLSGHNKKSCWKRFCVTGKLYVAVKLMPTHRYSTIQRKQVERKLREKYKPPCNLQ
jgi:predicted GIY-YIG superfamily endonuclease